MLLTIAFVILSWVLPPVLLVAGALRGRRDNAATPQRTDWQLLVLSTLLCTLAFNLTFFIQEFFLVLPKALVPGLHPILYHNDHQWTGTARIAELFQGSGAVAILISGLLFKLLFERIRSGSVMSLFTLWMALEGLFQALPQFVVGALLPGNDVGRAYAYLHLDGLVRVAIALLAMLAIPAAGIWLGRSFLSLSPDPVAVKSWRGRTTVLVRLVAIPALAAVPLIVLFRVPREIVEVLLLPLLVTLMAAGWVLAAAWIPGAFRYRGSPPSRPVLGTCAITLLLLAVFQLVLRHGIRFY